MLINCFIVLYQYVHAFLFIYFYLFFMLRISIYEMNVFLGRLCLLLRELILISIDLISFHSIPLHIICIALTFRSMYSVFNNRSFVRSFFLSSSIYLLVFFFSLSLSFSFFHNHEIENYIFIFRN